MSANSFSIVIQLPSGRELNLSVTPNMTIEDLKNMFAPSLNGILPEECKLLRKGQQLDPHNTIESYNIQPDEKLHVILVLNA